jgi:hypothetical protein
VKVYEEQGIVRRIAAEAAPEYVFEDSKRVVGPMVERQVFGVLCTVSVFGVLCTVCVMCFTPVLSPLS